MSRAGLIFVRIEMIDNLTRRAALLWASLAMLASVAPASAATVEILAVDNGWYRSDGVHSPSNPNIIEGNLGTFDYNNWFLFDLSNLMGEVVSATLTIFGGNGNYTGPESSATYSAYDVTTDLGLLQSGLGGVSAYADLGTGVQYGSTVIATPGTEWTPMPEVVLNLAGALPDLNAVSGGRFAVGGTSTMQYGTLWSSSGLLPGAKLTLETVVSPVPLPAGGLLLISAFAGAGLLRRRAGQVAGL